MALERKSQHYQFCTFIQLIVLLSLCASFQVNATTPQTWPWLAYIPSLNCTGAIVHSRWLLTTSYCFKNRTTIPSELFVQVQDFTQTGQGARFVYVIDYTRDDTHGFTMLYLARTSPSLTQNVVAMRANNANASMDKTGIVLSWDSRRANSDAKDFKIFALSVDVGSCIDNSPGHVCVTLSKHLASSSSILQYCSRLRLGSPLVAIGVDGKVALFGVLHERSSCQSHSTFIGRFSRVNYKRKWIRRQFRIQDFPQCQPSVYRTLDDPSRDLSKARDGLSALCDTEIPRAWYRFKLNGQPAELPTVCPAFNACGTPSSIWLPQGDVIELGQQVEIRACAAWSLRTRRICCFWKLPVFVRNCGDFKVYRLRRTDFCPTSYCAHVAKGLCGPGKAGYKPNCRDSYPALPKVLKFYPFYAQQGHPKRPFVYLRCLLYDAKKDETVKYLFSLYKVKKGKDGRRLKVVAHRAETTRRYFDVRLVPEQYQVGLGDTVTCEVRSFFQETRNIKSPALASPEFHLGVKVQPSSTLILQYAKIINVTFSITLPVLCRPEVENCYLTIPLTTSLTDSITGKQISPGSHFTISKCSLVYTTEHCNRDKLICGRKTIQIQAGKNFETSELKLRIGLGPIVSTSDVWKDHSIPAIEAILKPTSRFTCYSVSASNIRTFKGSFYKHLGEGTFLFYRSTSSSTEVQVQKWRCNGVATCPCAVAVREGNDVIMADMCHGQYKQSSLRFIIRSKLPLHKDTKILESNNGRSFAIKLPSGTEVNIDEFYWGISIYLSVTDRGKGLCRGAMPLAQETMKSLFDDTNFPSRPPTTTTQDLCSCSGLKSLNHTNQSCSHSTASLLETRARDITERIVNKQAILLKGFGLGTPTQLEHDEPLQADAPRKSLSYKRREEICHKILNSSDSLLVCKDILGKEVWGKIWQICVEETQEGLDMDLLKSSGDTLTALCKKKIEKMKDNQDLLRRWKNEMCENRCGQHGHCYQGNCKCNEGYGSSDCSVHLNTAPRAFPLDDPLCDLRREPCDEIFISGTPFLNFGSLSCSFTPVQRNGERWEENKQGLVTAKALYYSLRGVICRIPENQRSSVVKSQEAFHIRVSNTGYQWSNPVLRLGYDSLCKNCTSVESCATKFGTCSIDSRCFIHGDVSPNNPCLKCSSKDNPRKWTQRSDNLPPLFISPMEDTVVIFVGEEITFIVNASDPEGKALKITHNVPQARLTSDGKFRWKPDKQTTKTIQLLATDNCGRTSSKYVDVVVRACSCRNNGKCVKTSKEDFECSCPNKYKGVYCEIKISPCLPSPCFHGKCEEIGESYRCICDGGFHGNLCHLKFPACYSNPCKRGKCEEILKGFQCNCPRFYGGRYCEIVLSPCARDPCARGDCHSYDGETFQCVCPSGFHGNLCSKKTTACSPNPCHRGRCIDLGSSMRCACPPKHHGKYCNITGLYCGDTRCVNGACDTTGQKCVCHKGFIGKQCDTVCNIDCVNGACLRTPRETVCVCHAGFTGLSCRIKTKPCDSNPCMHGICINLNKAHLCHCYSGYNGTSCNISACSSVNCHNGTCILVDGKPVCRCLQDFIGDSCDRRRQPCDTNPCLHGLCIASKGNSFKCSCNPGFQGLLCAKKIDPCLSKPCGDGICQAKSNGTFACKCPPGYLDSFCKEKPKTNPCHMNPCVHGKCEVVSSTQFRCNCERSYVGRFCEKRFDICASNPCVNGRCSSVLEGTFSCACEPGFSGALCGIDHRPCSKNPCYRGVSCTNVNRQIFTCGECPSGYVGDGIKCSAVKDEAESVSLPCPRQFCFPGVQCSIVNSQIHCGPCPRGYLGNGFYCRVLCEIPCQNGGVCVSHGVCRCRQGFIGATCARAFCKRSCLNGGRCISPGKCRCSLAYFGERCENARCNVKCMHGGKCIPPGKCRCRPGYTGLACDQAVCSLPCLNGGQCVRPGTCHCLPGYFGTRCEEGTCQPPCRNGGICVRNNVCSCPAGYRDSRCQTAVCQRPCRNGGRCFKKDECSCPYGYWGNVCQFVNCVRPCLNGGVCIKPSVCLCPKDYAGVTCEYYVG